MGFKNPLVHQEQIKFRQKESINLQRES